MMKSKIYIFVFISSLALFAPCVMAENSRFFLAVRAGTKLTTPEQIRDTFSYDFWEEQIHFESILKPGLPILFGFQAGFFLTKNVAIQLGYDAFASKMTGQFNFTSPNPWFFSLPGEFLWENDQMELKTKMLRLSLQYIFLRWKSFEMSFYGGLSYFIVRISVFKDTDMIWEFPDKFSLENISYETYSSKTSGMNTGIGISYGIFEFIKICVNLEYYYAQLKTAIREATEAENIAKFNPGGAFVSAVLVFSF